MIDGKSETDLLGLKLEFLGYAMLSPWSETHHM